MRRKRANGIRRLPAVLILTAAGALGLSGIANAATPSPSPSATPSLGPSAGPSAAVSPGSGATAKKGITCTVTNTGHLTDCQKPVTSSKLPPGARNNVTVGQPASDLASLVDTRTWTTGGGNTFPGADVPFGMVQWTPDTRAQPQRRRRLQLRRHHAHRLQPDAHLRTGLRRRRRRADPAGHRGAARRRPEQRDHARSPTRARSRRRATTRRRATGPPTPSPRSSPRRRTARWASSRSRRTSDAGFDIKLQDSQTNVSSDTAQIVGNDEVQGSVTTGDFCGEARQRRPDPAVHGLLRHHLQPAVHLRPR